jgi:hypothetical protein
MHTKFWYEKTQNKTQPGFFDINIDRKIILNWNLNKQHGRLWIRFNWLRIETSGGPL